MKLNIECSAADLYLIAKAFQLAEMQADRNMNANKPRRSYRTTVSAGMDRKRKDTYEYQKELYGSLHDMFWMQSLKKASSFLLSLMLITVNGQPSLGHSAPRRYCCSKGPCFSCTQGERPKADPP